MTVLVILFFILNSTKHGKPALAKQYFILASRILVPMIVVSAFVESLI